MATNKTDKTEATNNADNSVDNTNPAADTVGSKGDKPDEKQSDDKKSDDNQQDIVIQTKKTIGELVKESKDELQTSFKKYATAELHLVAALLCGQKQCKAFAEEHGIKSHKLDEFKLTLMDELVLRIEMERPALTAGKPDDTFMAAYLTNAGPGKIGFEAGATHSSTQNGESHKMRVGVGAYIRCAEVFSPESDAMGADLLRDLGVSIV